MGKNVSMWKSVISKSKTNQETGLKQWKTVNKFL